MEKNLNCHWTSPTSFGSRVLAVVVLFHPKGQCMFGTSFFKFCQRTPASSSKKELGPGICESLITPVVSNCSLLHYPIYYSVRFVTLILWERRSNIILNILQLSTLHFFSTWNWPKPRYLKRQDEALAGKQIGQKKEKSEFYLPISFVLFLFL